MSTPYFALYPTDFLADVGHLGNTELGIYWRLLLVYYRDGRPLPVDTDKLRRIAMTFSPEECRVLDAVVSEFFVLSAEPDGTRVWRHKRADRELQLATERHSKAVAKAQRAAQARWERGSESLKDAPSIAPSIRQAMLVRCQPEPEPEPEKKSSTSIPPPPSAAPPRGRRSRQADLDLLLEAGVSQRVAEDWIAIRKAKRLPLTPTAMDGIRREADLAGLSVAEAVTEAVERGWAGFKASWLQRELAGNPRMREAEAALGKAGLATLKAATDFFNTIGDDDET